VNSVTIREALVSTLANDVLGDRMAGALAAGISALGAETAALLRRLEESVLNPRLPGRSAQ
jgi:hypothetical protein